MAYANCLGFMGGSSAELSTATHSIAQTKEIFGWLSEDLNAPHQIQTVTTSGSYTFRSISEDHLEGVKALKFQNGETTHLYIETRQSENQDQTPTFDEPVLDNTFLPTVNDTIFDGAVLSVSTPPFANWESNLLFDAKHLPGEPYLLDFPTWNNFTLPFDEVFVEPNSGGIVTIEDADSTGLYTAHITIGRTDFTPPSMTEPVINQELSTACEIVLEIEASDANDISFVEFYLYPTSSHHPPVDPVLTTLTPEGTYRVTVDRFLYRPYNYQFRAVDRATDIGLGLAPDNDSFTTLANISDLVADEGPCPLNEGEINILSELNDVMPPSFEIEVEFIHYPFLESIYAQLIGISFNFNHIIYVESQIAQAEMTIQDEVIALEPGSYRIALGTPPFMEQIFFDVVEREYLRGDVNLDGLINIADVIKITGYLFHGDTIYCLKAADTNDDGVVDIADAVYLANYLFTSGDEPPPPFNEAGQDPTDDSLSCH